jgi:uncharacterized membrane protein (UPF0127 family)
MRRHATALPALLMLVIALVACSSTSPAPDDNLTRLEIVGAGGEAVSLRVEIADTEAERSVGLSNRASLPAGNGMLFVIEQRGRGFWMKDTTIPLSVAFIGPCGEIVAIADMEPLSLQIHNTEQTYAYGLEVNQGWFGSHGVGVGSRVEIPLEYRQAGCT